MDIKGIVKRVIKRIQRSTNWSKIEYFNADWKTRIKLMAQFVEPGDSVLDLGCGQMWLKEFLPADCVYIPVDYKKRGEDTIVCDFNRNQFPEIKVKAAFLSGCFEYIVKYDSFVSQLRKYCDKVVISYVSTEDESDMNKRVRNAWKNHLAKNQFIKLFIRKGFVLDKTINDGRFNVYVFTRNLNS